MQYFGDAAISGVGALANMYIRVHRYSNLALSLLFPPKNQNFRTFCFVIRARVTQYFLILSSPRPGLLLCVACSMMRKVIQKQQKGSIPDLVFKDSLSVTACVYRSCAHHGSERVPPGIRKGHRCFLSYPAVGR